MKDGQDKISESGGNPGAVKVDQSNLNEYRVLRSEGDIIGYAEWSEWSEPLEGYPHGLICDPIVPGQNPIGSYQITAGNDFRTH